MQPALEPRAAVEQAQQALQGSRIADRAVVLRIAKHMDRVIGPDTRAVGPAGDPVVHPPIG